MKTMGARWSHIIPLAVGTYVLAYVDRVNVSMILPYVDRNFGLTPAGSGFAAGIFFIGYMFLQIPGGMLASRWSARRLVAILILLWGLTAVATGFVETRAQLYLARFMLGVFEGGVWPAILVLLGAWFPSRERASATALWIACLPLCAAAMAPLTGWLLTFLSWRQVFIVEGLPPFLVLIPWWLLVADRPAVARWVSAPERAYLEAALAAEAARKKPASGSWAALTDPAVLGLTAAYFFWIAGFYGLTMWIPAAVKHFWADPGPVRVGLLSAVPFLCGALALVLNSSWSDRTMRRQAFIVAPLALGAAGLILGPFAPGATLQMLCLVLAAMGIYAAFGPFWAVPASLLPAELAGAAMGLIDMGNLGGFFGPYIVGALREATGGGFTGFLVLGLFLLVAAGIVALLRVDRRLRQLTPPLPA